MVVVVAPPLKLLAVEVPIFKTSVELTVEKVSPAEAVVATETVLNVLVPPLACRTPP
jgi:hypothetical protein